MPLSVLQWKLPTEIPPVFAAAGALVAFMGEDHVCRSMSVPFAALMRTTPEQIVGRRAADVLPAEMAAEREQLFRQVFSTGRPVQFTEAVGGTRFRTTFAPATISDGQIRGLVIILTPLYLLPGDVAATLPHAKHNVGDPLEGLTRAEVDLLRLIGAGLSSQQISTIQHRSIKTIESHRASLGRKLKVSNRVELASIAIRAGLISLLPDGVDASPRNVELARSNGATARRP